MSNENTEVKVEDVPPELEETTQQPAETSEESAAQKAGSNRTEKKTRKAFEKMGLKAYEGVVKVSLKLSRGLYSIDNPEVFKSTGETYIVVGEARAEDFKNSAVLQELLKQAQLSQGAETTAPAATTAEEETEETVDETGIEAADIDLVLQSAPQGTSRAKAVKALREKGNAVDAVMALTGVN